MKNQKSLKISSANAKFNCRVSGEGEKVLICFHGFGQDGRAFQAVVKNMPAYTLYSFDLPFHGETEVLDPSSLLTAGEICDVVQELLNIAQIMKFSVIAFSIGARIAYPITEVFGSKVEHLWLLAPDGLWNNFWFNLATGNRYNQRIFSYFMQKPEVMFEVLLLLKSVRLLDDQIYKLIKRSIDTSARRAQVYHTWTYLSRVKGSIDRLSSVAGINGFQIEIFIGDGDKITPAKRMEKLANRNGDISVVVLKAGHEDLIQAFAKKSLEALKS